MLIPTPQFEEDDSQDYLSRLVDLSPIVSFTLTVQALQMRQ